MKALLLVLLATTTAHAHRACEEVSNIVGREHCEAFGNWSAARALPNLEIDTELFHERLGGDGSLVAARGTETAATGGNAWGIRERLAWRLFGPAYLGVELDLGGIATGPRVMPMIAGRVFGGVHALVTSDFMLSAELAGGGRAASDERGSLLELRGRFDWWATPHLTVGIALGTSLLDREDHTLTFGLGGHLRAFDY